MKTARSWTCPSCIANECKDNGAVSAVIRSHYNTCNEHHTQAQCITIHHGSLEMIFVHNQSGTGYFLVSPLAGKQYYCTWVVWFTRTI